MIILIDTEIAFNKIKYTLTKILQVGIKRTYLNIIKTAYDKPTATIIHNNGKLKAFPPNSGVRQGFPLPPLLFNIVLEDLTTAVRQKKEIKAIQIEREVKLLLFT